MSAALLTMVTDKWWDIRDLSNLSGKILDLIRDAGGPEWLIYVVSGVLGAGGIVTFIGVAAILNVWVERRVIGRMQSRLGPNRVGPFGLLQTIADAMKLMQKENLHPRAADGLVFGIAPIVFTVPGILLMAVVPWGRDMTLADLDAGVLFVLAVSSVTSLIIFVAGYSQNNKYAMFGAMRVVAMLVSYEIPIVLALLGVVLMAGSMNLSEMVLFQEKFWVLLVMLQPLPFLIFFIASSAELGRSPADIAEAESELGGGYHTEYSGMKWGLFYAAELINAVAVSAIISTIFLGGWWMYRLDEIVPGWMIYIGKVYGVYFLFVWTRGTLPRFRIDQLLAFAWKWMLPLALANIVIVAGEVTLWEESGWSAGALVPAFVVANNVLAMILIGAWLKFLSPGFQRFPPRLRMYSEIEVPPLPAPAIASPRAAGGAG